jgi:hypothetical protein
MFPFFSGRPPRSKNFQNGTIVCLCNGLSRQVGYHECRPLTRCKGHASCFRAGCNAVPAGSEGLRAVSDTVAKIDWQRMEESGRRVGETETGTRNRTRSSDSPSTGSQSSHGETLSGSPEPRPSSLDWDQKSLGAKSFRSRRHVCHSWSVPGDS